MPTIPPLAPPPRPHVEWQVARAHGWLSLPEVPAGGQLRVPWTEPVVRAVFHLAGTTVFRSCRVQLQGGDSGWADVRDGDWRLYTHLGHGRHRLQIQPDPESPHPTCRATMWELVVGPPPWLQWWAWLGYLGVLSASGLLASRVWRPWLPGDAPRCRWIELAHELKSPVAGLLGMAELLAATPLSRRQCTYVEAMRHSGTLLMRLVDEALRPAGGTAATGLQTTVFRPEQLCRQVLALMRPMAEVRRLRLEFVRLGGVPTRLEGDPQRIEQILFNLLGNAIKYTPTGYVRLAIAWRKERWWLWISDSGPGMPWWQRRRVFLPRVRLRDSAASPGRGLGLAITRAWVHRMGGRIWLRAAPAATGPRRGTVVSLWLPLRRLDTGTDRAVSSAWPSAGCPPADARLTCRVWPAPGLAPDTVANAAVSLRVRKDPRR
ncbi:sensor histidine kinase [Frateuria aurantia]